MGRKAVSFVGVGIQVASDFDMREMLPLARSILDPVGVNPVVNDDAS